MWIGRGYMRVLLEGRESWGRRRQRRGW